MLDMKPPTQPIQLIALDLDGTVFHDDKTISEATIQAMKDASMNGITVVPATGRPLAGLPDEILALPDCRYAICCNGAAVYDLKAALSAPPVISKDRFNSLDTAHVVTVCENLLPLDTVLSILSCTMKNPAVMNEVFVDGFGYSQSDGFHDPREKYAGAPIYDYVKKTRVPMENMPEALKEMGASIEKMHILYPDKESRDESLRELERNPLPCCCITYSMDNNLEINAATANKGAGLLALASILGIPRAQVMACGDSGNDTAMLKAAGYGVAMGNAPEAVKASADAVTLTNNEDGAAAAIRFVLDSNRKRTP